MGVVLEHGTWAVPSDEWAQVGGDYVFSCEANDGMQRRFRLRQDIAAHLFEAALAQARQPTGMLLQFELGLGPWGDEPWHAPDFRQCIAQLEAPSDESLAARDPQNVAARRDLLLFLKERRLAGDSLVIDDGTGQANRFPPAPGWTETGKPLGDTILVRYRPCAKKSSGWEFATMPISRRYVAELSRLPAPPPDLASFLSDPARHNRGIDAAELLSALSAANLPQVDLIDFVRSAVEEALPLVIQSAARLPNADPD